MTDKILEVLLNNAPLVVAIGSLYVWVTPRMIKSTLKNGAGDIVKDIVRAANAEQSLETQAAIGSVRERLAVVETRIKDHLEAKR